MNSTTEVRGALRDLLTRNETGSHAWLPALLGATAGAMLVVLLAGILYLRVFSPETLNVYDGPPLGGNEERDSRIFSRDLLGGLNRLRVRSRLRYRSSLCTQSLKGGAPRSTPSD
jgi:hypothetical protein